jgi:hypothetical protein
MVEFARRPDGEHPGGLGELVFGETPLGLEPPTLGRCEALVGQPEVGDLCEHLARPLEPLLQRHGGGAERRSAAAAIAHHLERLGQELLALGSALAAVAGSDQCQALVDLEPMLPGGERDRLLDLGAEPTERIRQRRAELAAVDAVRYRGAEPRRQQQALCYPPFLAARHRRDRGNADALAVQRAHDPRLVHGRQRAWRGVAPQQEHLGFEPGGRLLDDDRHFGRTAIAPTAKPLEAIDDL